MGSSYQACKRFTGSACKPTRCKTLHAGKGQIKDWQVAKNKNRKRNTNKVYKIEEDKGGMLKFKSYLKSGPKRNEAKTERELQNEKYVIARTGLIVDAEDLKVAVKEGAVVDAMSSLKQLGIQMEESGSTTEIGELMEVKILSCVSLYAASTRTPSGIHTKADACTVQVAST